MGEGIGVTETTQGGSGTSRAFAASVLYSCVLSGVPVGMCQVNDYWGPAKKMLADMKFLDSLKTYDKDNIPVKTIEQIREKYMPNPDFVPERIAKVSVDAYATFAAVTGNMPGFAWVGFQLACIMQLASPLIVVYFIRQASKAAEGLCRWVRAMEVGSLRMLFPV